MKFTSAVRHDGKDYKAGDTVPSGLTESELKALKDAGVVDTGKVKPAEDNPDTPEDESDVTNDDAPVNPNDYNKAELIELANERGVEVEETETKAEIAEKINNA